MNSSPTRVTLLVPRTEAEALISQAMQRGEEIMASATSVRDEASFSEWAKSSVRWRKLCEATLHKISDGDALAEEFRNVSSRPRVGFLGGPEPTLGEKLDRRLKTHSAELNVLASVSERLPLFSSEDDGGSDGSTASEAVDKGELENEIFIVHGRQRDAAEMVARFMEQIGLTAIILDEQPNRGDTVIEKFEANAARAAFAVVLVLADDWGRGPDDDDFPVSPNRARQNVILELGYFVGKLGRENVVALMGEGVEKPSDINGLVYVEYNKDWQMRLMREIKSAIPSVDANAMFKA